MKYNISELQQEYGNWYAVPAQITKTRSGPTARPLIFINPQEWVWDGESRVIYQDSPGEGFVKLNDPGYLLLPLGADPFSVQIFYLDELARVVFDIREASEIVVVDQGRVVANDPIYKR